MTADAVIRLAELALAFGRVERKTYHPDGLRRETDTDHTVMLTLVACALAPPHLDRGLIAQYATVHDLPEAYAGDTNTLRLLTEQERAAKKRREHDAGVRIAREFADLPWLARTIAAYEHQVDAEARYVRAVDKVVPKLCHLLNGGATIAEEGMGRAELAERWQAQTRELAELAAEFPAVESLRAQLVARLLDGAR